MTRSLVFAMGGILPLAFLATVLAFARFDRLLQIFFAEHRDDWENRGCPPGFFWTPQGSDIWLGSGSRSGLFWEWQARMPGWVSGSEAALNAFRRLKQMANLSKILFGIFLSALAALLISIFAGSIWGLTLGGN